ncbi:MAG: toll/interleukin-1 receptor domain-containing protein [Candidatus Hermodarchaeota archaeon]
MIKVFFSYSEKERDKYSISKLAQLLESKPNIEIVYHWERDAKTSIIQYLDEIVPQSDICVFFYSSDAVSSDADRPEQKMAISQAKHIIPVFMDLKDVPHILRIQTGINATNKTSEQILDGLYQLIAAKFDINAQ